MLRGEELMPQGKRPLATRPAMLKPLKVDADLHHELKVYAVTEGRQLLDVTNDAIRDYLRKVKRGIVGD